MGPDRLRTARPHNLAKTRCISEAIFLRTEVFYERQLQSSNGPKVTVLVVASPKVHVMVMVTPSIDCLNRT